MQFCDTPKNVQLLHGKTADRPCTNNFPHRHLINGKPATKDFVIARPLEPVATAPVKG